MEITVREYDKSITADEIAELVQKAYSVWDKYGYDYAARKYKAEDIRKLLGQGNCLTAFADGQLVGVLFYFTGKKYKEFNTENSAYTHVFAVDPDFSGHGIGNKLFDCACQRAKEADCGEYILDTCAENKTLINWYKKRKMLPVSYTSYPNTSYYSIIFLKPLNKSYSKFYYLRHRVTGKIKALLFYKADGSLKPAAKLLRKIKGL